MNFADQVTRTEFPPIAEALSWVKDRQSARPLLNMCQAVPSYPPAEKLQVEIARLAHEPGTGGYTDIFGIGELRQVFAEHLTRDYRTSVKSENVAITTGCNQAFGAAVMSVAQAGDNILLPAPWYFNHNMWLTMLGIEARPVAAFAHNRPYPSVEEAAAAVDHRTRAILLCSPNNPTGAIYPPEVLKEFYDFAKARGLWLIVDETYKDFRELQEPAHRLFEEPDWQNVVVQLHSFSKIYALAGYRLGAMVAGEKLLHEAAKILDCMTICPPQITQRAVVYALAHLDAWKFEKKQLMRGRLDAIRTAFAKHPTGYQMVSSGAYFAYIKHPFRGLTSKQVAIKLAKQHDLLCLPGSMFGPGQEDYLRLAFANVDADLMPQLTERLAESEA
jgi:aspartate/methionine/tyrosine aminotransferase